MWRVNGAGGIATDVANWARMNIGLKTILLAVATVLFVIAALVGIEHQLDWMSWGLAVAAAGFLVGELGLGTSMNWGGTRSSTNP